MMYRLAPDLSAAVGLEFGINEYETRQLHDEIVVRGCYDDGSGDRVATVIDLGANVGVFAAWARRRWPDARIVCVEPVPEIAAVLRRNFAADRRVEVIEVAVGLREGVVEVTYFPECSILSGVGVAPGDAEAKIRDYVLDWAGDRIPGMSPQASERLASALAQRRAMSRPRVVRCATLASIIETVGAVDLLKIDIEGAEHEVLASLDPASWDRIERLAVEPELSAAETETIRSLVEDHGFRLTRTPTSLVARRWEGPRRASNRLA